MNVEAHHIIQLNNSRCCVCGENRTHKIIVPVDGTHDVYCNPSNHPNKPSCGETYNRWHTSEDASSVIPQGIPEEELHEDNEVHEKPKAKAKKKTSKKK